MSEDDDAALLRRLNDAADLMSQQKAVYCPQVLRKAVARIRSLSAEVAELKETLEREQWAAQDAARIDDEH